MEPQIAPITQFFSRQVLAVVTLALLECRNLWRCYIFENVIVVDVTLGALTWIKCHASFGLLSLASETGDPKAGAGRDRCVK